VFGQRVRVTASTVFGSGLPAGLARVSDGSIAEIFGFWDAANGAFVATRIQPRKDLLVSFKLRGPVRNLDRATRTFNIGPVAFAYATAPEGLDNGVFVRLQVETTPLAGKWVVRAFGNGLRSLPDVDRVRLQGSITSLNSSRSFSVNGQPVDASAASFPDGEAGLALGVRVELEGSVGAGVVRATKVGIDGDRGPPGGFELKGAIESHQPVAQTFVMKGVTVFYGTAGVRFDDGTAADLRTGADIEVRGVLSADGTRLLATRIRFRK